MSMLKFGGYHMSKSKVSRYNMSKVDQWIIYFYDDGLWVTGMTYL